MRTPRSQQMLQDSLSHVRDLLERHRVLEQLTRSQEVPNRELLEVLQRRQNVAELHHKLRALHPADLAHILEALPTDDRLTVWREIEPGKAGEVLVEMSRAVRGPVVEATDPDALRAILAKMDADDIAYVAEDVPSAILEEVYRTLDARDRVWVESSVSLPEGSVGVLMTPEVVSVREGWTVEACLAEIRRCGRLPRQADSLFVIDGRHVLRGAIALQDVLVSPPERPVAELMREDVVAFTPDDRASQAAAAFERYDLVSAPVVDDRGKLVGRVTVDAVMDFLRREAELRDLKRAGLSGEEDLFAPVWASARNRWSWLALNLVTAFLASRVIGVFSETIEKLVALATLMPVVASVGGNTGNQTVALLVRALALDQVTAGNLRHLVAKELGVSLVNGLMWGAVMGTFALVLYRSAALGLVMAAAILLNLLVAAVVGLAVPFLLQRSGRDPAQGASVLLTFTTDGMGFFLFLGLARAFLV
jgi:magnesium transporter